MTVIVVLTFQKENLFEISAFCQKSRETIFVGEIEL